MRLPARNGKFVFLCWFARWAWLIFAVSRLSLAASSIGSICSITSAAVAVAGFVFISGTVSMGGRIQGDFPKRNWKGVYPVNLFSVFIMSNLTFGKACNQPR